MSDKAVLVDTSVWVEYFRGRNPEVAGQLDHLLDGDRVVTFELIEAELFRGSRSEKEIHFLEEYFSQLPRLEPSPDLWRKVGRFSYQMARRGYLPHLVDTCIAFTAIENRVSLFSRDSDFKRIAPLSELHLYVF